MKRKGLKSVPSQVQLPGGVTLKGLPFRILTYNDDGSPKTFELLPAGSKPTDAAACTLFADETWIRSPLSPPVKTFQGPGTSGHPTDCRCAACRNFDD